MGGTAARWRSSSAPTSKTPPVSRSRRWRRSLPLHPANEAELSSGADPVATVGMVSRPAGGARAEDVDRRHARAREQQAGRRPEIDVVAAGTSAPRLRGRAAGPCLESLTDLAADLVATSADRRPDDRLDRAGIGAGDVHEVPEGRLEHAGRAPAPARMDGSGHAPSRLDQEHGNAVRGHDPDQHAGVCRDQPIGLGHLTLGRRDDGRAVYLARNDEREGNPEARGPRGPRASVAFRAIEEAMNETGSRPPWRVRQHAVAGSRPAAWIWST